MQSGIRGKAEESISIRIYKKDHEQLVKLKGIVEVKTGIPHSIKHIVRLLLGLLPTLKVEWTALDGEEARNILEELD